MREVNPKVGDVLAGRYVLRDLIGEGGMGMVYAADQPALGRRVAIKILHRHLAPNRDMVARFYEEALAASRVRHPGSITVFDCSALPDGTPYLVMQFVAGEPLARIIAAQRMPLRRAVAIIDQILAILEAAHDSGVVHGDVKAENVLVEQIDRADHVTMIDYGLARLDGAAGALHDLVSGTPEYMAPELIRAEVPTVASDVYAVGVLLYELITGATPFGGKNAEEILHRQAADAVVPPSLRRPDQAINAELDRVVLRALAKQPRDRFRGARAFSRALRLACGSRPAAIAPDRALRRAIGEALVRGDAGAVARAYGALAGFLTRRNHYAAAAHELEEAIEILTSPTPTRRDPAIVGPLVRALTELAARLPTDA
jgi:serine/threonine-protein kinase